MKEVFSLLGLQTDCKKEHSVEAASCIISALIWKLSTPDKNLPRGRNACSYLLSPFYPPTERFGDIAMSLSSVRPYVRP